MEYITQKESRESKLIKPATLDLAWKSSKLLRWQDKREMEGLGHPPFIVLPTSVALSEDAISFYTPANELCGFAGVVKEENDIGLVWMLTTKAVEKIPILFFKEAKKWIERQPYTMLHNIADPRNTMHMKLLHMLGFKRLCYKTVGPKSLTYVEFAKLCVNQSL